MVMYTPDSKHKIRPRSLFQCKSQELFVCKRCGKSSRQALNGYVMIRWS